MTGKQIHSHTETEVKVRVGDLAAIEGRIRTAGGTLHTARVYEKNVRYEDAQGSLLPAKRVLRLRQDNSVRLTYKEPSTQADAVQNGVLTRTELEVTVSDFETMELLLGKLGFHPAWIYEKYRTTYQLEGCEITLDELPMGNFIEIEGETEGIERVLAKLDLTDVPRITESYSELFFDLKAAKGLTFRDLTFENFKGMIIP